MALETDLDYGFQRQGQGVVEEQTKSQTEVCKVQAVINQQDQRLAKAHSVQVLVKLQPEASIAQTEWEQTCKYFQGA